MQSAVDERSARVIWAPLAVLVCAGLACAVALAQAPAAPERDAPPPDQLEPAVNTTPAAPAPAPAASDALATPSAPAAAGAGKVPRKAALAAGPAARKGPDRLELEAAEITGNRELPKVLYIVPWKRSDLGDLVGKPVNSLLDEVLQPLDRDVFRRENRYYDALKPDQAVPKTGTAPGSESKP